MLIKRQPTVRQWINQVAKELGITPEEAAAMAYDAVPQALAQLAKTQPARVAESESA